MRLHQITSAGDRKFALELHPRLTLLAGLGDDRAAELAEVLEEVIRGRADGVEALLELEDQPLLLDEWRQRANGELGSVEVILRASDLPGASHEAAAVAAARQAGRDLERAEDALAVARRAVADFEVYVEDDASGPIRDAVAQAANALAQAERTRASLREEISQARAAAAAAPAAPAAARASATDADTSATERATRHAELDRRRRDIDGELAAIVPQRDELERERATLADRRRQRRPDPEAVAAVSEALDAASKASDPEDERKALELLGQMDGLTDADRPTEFAAVPQWLLNSARQTLEEARLAAVQAEEAAKPFSISPADAADLERAQRDVVAAEAKASRVLSGPLARHRLDAANAVLQGVLDRIGVPSYSAYLLRVVKLDERNDKVDALEWARRALADAEAVWEELRRSDAGAPDVRTERELRWRAEVVTLLSVGEDDDLESLAQRLALVAHQGGSARAALAETLGRLLIPLEPGDDPEAAATHWLEAARQEAAAPDVDQQLSDVGARLEAIAATQSRLTAQRAAVEAQLDELVSIEPAPAGEDRPLEADLAERAAAGAARVVEIESQAVRADQRVEDARMAHQVAEAALAAVDGAPASDRHGAKLDQLQAEVAVRQREVESARAARDRAVARNDQGDDQPAATDTDREIYVLARLAALRSVGSFGALPLVMVDPFSGLERDNTSKLHATLERMSEVVQLVYFTDSPEAIAWAEGIGRDGAAVLNDDSLVPPEPAPEPSGAEGRTVKDANLRRGPHGFGHRRRRA